jgi:polar amino acid transport system substrate-binding protein
VTYVSQRDPHAERTLIVGIRHIPPFTIKGEDDTWSGVSVGLWKSIAENLSFEYQFRECPKVSALPSACESGTVDVGMAAMTVTAERENHIVYSIPFYSSGVAVRKSDNAGILSGIRTLCSIEALLAIATGFAILLLIGALSWVSERKANSDHFDRKMLCGIWDGIWFAAVTMTTVGYGDGSRHEQFLVGCWYSSGCFRHSY